MAVESPITHHPPRFDDFPTSPSEIRVRVHNAVMKSPIPIPSSSSLTPSTSTTLVDSSPSSSVKSRDTDQILASLPTDTIEVASSSYDNPSSQSYPTPASVPSLSSRIDKSGLFRSKSVADLRPCGLSDTPPSSPIPSVKSVEENNQNKYSSENLEGYEDEVPDLDPFAIADGDSSWSGKEDDPAPILLFNRKQRTTRSKVDPAVMALLLSKCIGTSPPPQTAVHRASKRPELPTIYSAPGSPTENIRAVRERKELNNDVDAISWTDSDSEGSVPGRRCKGCGRKKSVSVWMKLIPCQHIVCSQCFSASISGVTVSRGPSSCPSCFEPTYSMEMLGDIGPMVQSLMLEPPKATKLVNDVLPVLRIDNVAWDVTPQVVRDYLPPQVLPRHHPQPVHILLDRYDGRTKDYMYIEVASEEAARKVLKYRQNSFMPCGPAGSGRRRPVTITSVPLAELLNELRPRSAAELHGLLALCHAAVCAPHFVHSPSGFIVPPAGLAHFVKSRHGPFYAVMSILTKLHGPSSPSYWDSFNLASGAMKALSLARCQASPGTGHMSTLKSIQEQDQIVLNQLTRLFHSTFRNFQETQL